MALPPHGETKLEFLHDQIEWIKESLEAEKLCLGKAA